MRCDLSTCSSAHISLLVSGSAQTCFNDQARRIYFDKSWVLSICFHLWALQVHKYTNLLCNSFFFFFFIIGSSQILENHIKNELIEKSQLVHALPSSEETKLPLSEPRKSTSIACGASVFEVCMKVPTWASQVTFLLSF